MTDQPVLTDPLHMESGPDTVWTTVNTAEAIPGVPTPLGWTLWCEPLERAMRGAFCDIGVLRPAEVTVAPRPDQRYSGIFFGRFTANVDQMRAMADRLPGTSADALEEQLLGGVRPDAVSHPSKARYPAVGVKMPRAMISTPQVLAQRRKTIDAWWRHSVANLTPANARARFAEAQANFEWIMRPHSVQTMLAQAMYEQLAKLSAAAGRAGLETRLSTGYGHMEETELMADLWSVSRDRMSIDEFLDRHGYHGPGEGEISNRSWREDKQPLLALIEAYRSMPESSGPTTVTAQRMAERDTANAELLAGLPWLRRAGAKPVLALAKRHIPAREVGKAAFLQCLDVARAAARMVGEELAERGISGSADDVFYLTVEEFLAPEPPAGSKQQVAFRREQRDEYLGLRVPDTWTGTAVPEKIEAAAAAGVGSEITGLGVSPGVAEGRARVVADPATSEPLEPGEILVCQTTDPSWTSMFLVADGLVIDIGGAISHGAIVAREMGVPCVINTRVGTSVLRTGDLLRVDGNSGIVTVVERA